MHAVIAPAPPGGATPADPEMTAAGQSLLGDELSPSHARCDRPAASERGGAEIQWTVAIQVFSTAGAGMSQLTRWMVSVAAH